MSQFERRAGGSSYLVRIWREPGDNGGAELPPRFYVRNLRSGEERYLEGADHLAEYFRHEPAERPVQDSSSAEQRQAG